MASKSGATANSQSSPQSKLPQRHRYLKNTEVEAGPSTSRQLGHHHHQSSIPEHVGHPHRTSVPEGSRKSGQGPEYILHLEEAKGLPIFWNGKEIVSRFTWKMTAGDIKFSLMSIGEVLEKFTAKDYLRYSNVAMSINNRVYSTLRVSDAFTTLFRGNEDGKAKSVKLILNEAFKSDRSKELAYKYLLILTEVNKKKALWDGRKSVTNMVARVDESHMLLTVETMLKKYLPTDYLRNDVTMQVILGETIPESVKDVKLDDILGSIFQGTSASLRISNRKSDPGKADSSPASEKLSPGTDLEVFENSSLESFWLSGNWNEIREKVQYLLETVDVVEREREISKYFHQKMMEERRTLETAMRRRNRSIDEVWRAYEVLKTTVDMASTTFRYKSLKSDQESKTSSSINDQISASISDLANELLGNLTNTSINNPAYPANVLINDQINESISDQANDSTIRRDPPPPSDSSQALRLVGSTMSASCMDGFAQRLRGCGLEIYDEDNRISPIAGVAFTVIVVVLVSAIAHYVS